MLVEQRMAVKIRRHTLFPRDTISVHNCLLMSEIFIICAYNKKVLTTDRKAQIRVRYKNKN